MATIDIHIRLEPGDINVDQARWETFARDPGGPIARDMHRRADNVSEAMVVPEDTGRLKRTKRVTDDFGGRLPSSSVVVGEPGETDYLGFVLDGTRPHDIVAKGKALKFVSGGQIVFRKRVRHPGTTANDFMNAALPAAID